MQKKMGILCLMGLFTFSSRAMDDRIAMTEGLCKFLVKYQKKEFDPYIYLRVKNFLKEGALPNRAIHGARPLYLAIKGKMPCNVIVLLINKDAIVNFSAMHGVTPLHAAVRNNDEDVVNVLLKARAWRIVEDYDGNLPLHYAIMHKASSNIIAALLAECTINYQNKQGDTPLHLAVMSKNEKLIAQLLNAGADQELKNKKGETPFDLLGAPVEMGKLGLVACTILHSMSKSIAD